MNTANAACHVTSQVSRTSQAEFVIGKGKKMSRANALLVSAKLNP